ncbi:MAG: beta-lactamase class [Amycolatopsis sp.]|uniref:MBL fold metallo-hydrolase n=1 Tax=Amycolatopsis sp. TaxID=37632 RepID=UPI002608EF6C|nr:MBL fold metallo-hydrolase [Amycolatopsis sp.]MCU1687091.1 beta-lactamase class [Amycolatopsis sp.]
MTPTRRTFLTFAALTVPVASGLLALPGTAQGAVGDLPDYLPIPPSSMGPALNSDGYYVGQIKGNLYWVTDSFYQSMFLTTREGVVVVDAPPTIGRNLQRAIDEVTKTSGKPSKVTHLVYSHSHADHIGAATIFGADVERVAHRETGRLLRETHDPNRPLPTITFDDHYTLRVGGELLQLDYHGPNHSADNIFIYAPKQETLMLVDVLFPGWVPFKQFGISQEIPNWVRMHDVALSYPWRTLVGGHLGRLGTRADATLQKDYVTDLRVNADAAIAGLDPAPYLAKYGPTGNAWAIFKSYLDAATRQASDAVIAKYAGKLAAVDVFTFDNQFTMLESLRTDGGHLGPFGIHQ